MFLLTGCKQEELLVVTTTSLENSGLLAYIIPAFEEEYDIKVKIVAVGTGAALELGRLGEADILLVHDMERELDFVQEGYGEKRDNIMYNDFILVGPHSLQSTTLQSVLQEIVDSYSFYSRGDESGTHAKELYLWSVYGFDVSSFGEWYKETGQSMGSTLTMTSLSGYFTLSDRSTYLSMKESLDLVIVYENREELQNQYGVIKVNSELHNRDEQLADLFYNWIIREDTQQLINSYSIHDEQLFFGNAGE